MDIFVKRNVWAYIFNISIIIGVAALLFSTYLYLSEGRQNIYIISVSLLFLLCTAFAENILSIISPQIAKIRVNEIINELRMNRERSTGKVLYLKKGAK